jgi:NAD(P)-dependent dehydrogenase (short-subunit alcohol dehydrogenase family)
MESTISLKGRCALVTGASRGVGRQIAKGLAEHGCNLILHARKLDNLAAVAGELRDSGVRIDLLGAELSELAEVDRLWQQTLQISPRIDVIYNNAAIQAPWHDLHSTPIEEYYQSFAINVIALVRICDYALPLMKKQGFGRIINVTSGIENLPELMPYSVSKAAVDRYVRDFVPALKGTGVVMSLLDPGWCKTDLGSDAAPNEVESVLPGALLPALLPDDAPSGQLFCAQDYR